MASVSFSGVATGIQWNDIVDQLMNAETARNVTPLTSRLSLIGRQRAAWGDFKGLVQTLSDAARKLRTGSAFSQFAASGGTSPTSGRALVSATATGSAAPGAYDVEVVSLARTQKIGGAVVADADAALGLTGSFTVAGQSVTVSATDTLSDVRNRINTLNSGSTPTKVSAAIVSGPTGGARLVLSAQTAGSAGVALADGSEGVLRQLGLMDSRSRLVSSDSTSVAAAIGGAAAGATTLSVNGRSIAVDLGTDSLQDLAARIRAAGVSASVETEPYGSGSSYRLVVGGNVTATGDAGSADALAALQFGAGTSGADRQILSAGVLGAAGGGTAAGSTSLVGLTIGGTDGQIAAGDAIQIKGTRGDGSAVSLGLTVQAGDTVDTLLARLNDATEGFGAGTRPAQAVLGSDGTLRLIDGQGGESQLSLSLSVMNPDGATVSFGAAAVEAAGRTREIVAGADAQVRVDGVLYTRGGNDLSDVIPGVTLALKQAEPGVTTTITVARDEAATVQAMKDVVNAYNAIAGFMDAQAADGMPLKSNPSLRSAMRSITDALRVEVSDAGDYSRGAVVGLALDRYGKLQLDETRFKEALAAAPESLATLFGSAGVGKALEDASTVITRFGDGLVANAQASLDSQKTAVERRRTEAERRIELRRSQMEAQFIAMESLVSTLQSQGSWLSTQLAQLQTG